MLSVMLIAQSNPFAPLLGLLVIFALFAGLLLIIAIVLDRTVRPGLLRQILARATDASEKVPVDLPYRKREYLFTRTEAEFYRSLVSATTSRFTVVGKVRMGDVLEVRGRGDQVRTFQNKVRSKHFDFVLCEPGTMRIVAAIELDDSSHQRTDRVARDEFVDRACRSAGLTLVRFPAAALYDPAAIGRQLDQALTPATTSGRNPFGPPAPARAH